METNFISEEKIKEFIDEMLKDSEINTIIPDSIERKIYTNVTKLVLEIMKKSLESTTIKFLNHEVKLSINPST